MDWQVLDWNEPALNFYKKCNAILDSEWINGKFTDAQLARLQKLVVRCLKKIQCIDIVLAIGDVMSSYGYIV